MKIEVMGIDEYHEYECSTFKLVDGALLIMDQGIKAMYAPGRWLEVDVLPDIPLKVIGDQ